MRGYRVQGITFTAKKAYADWQRIVFLVHAVQMRQPSIVGRIQRFSKWIARATRVHSAGKETVLVISKEGYDSIGRLCRRLEWELNYATGLPIALMNLRTRRFDVVIYDQDMPDQDWRVAITSLAAIAPASSIILLSPLGHPELWNEVIRRGGHDTLTKPICEDGVESAVALAMARAKVSRSRSDRRVSTA